jgi:hypothetical protein
VSVCHGWFVDLTDALFFSFWQLEDYEQQLLEMANISREEYLASLRRSVIKSVGD